MIGKETALRLLRKVVEQSPADQTEAVLMTEDSSLTRFAHSSVHQHVAERNATLILRVVLGKKIAVVTTNRLDASLAKDVLQKAISLAKAQKPNEAFLSLPRPRPIPVLRTYHESIDSLTPREKVKRIQKLFALAREKGLGTSGAFSSGKVEVVVLSSLGIEAYQRYSDVFFHLVADNGEHSGYASYAARSPEGLDIESLSHKAFGKIRSGKRIEIEPGEYETILEPYAVSELLSFLGSLGFHALAVQEGRSFLCDAMGKQMVDPKVTIYDDGLDPEGLQIPFDFEGIPKSRVTFFENGIAQAITYDSLTAGREGKESTGHALMAPNTEGPIPLNLFMRSGESTLEEMVRSVRRGVYVTRFHYTNVVEPMKAIITGMTRDGTFLIEEGEIKQPLRNLRFTESILRALGRVKAISRDRSLCSEGTVYSRRFITGTVAPALQVDGFNFSGISTL